MKAKNGDFVTATVDLREPHPTRQGILDGNLLRGESGETYKVVRVEAVVSDRSLWGSTLKFVTQWRKRRASR